jgi:hypothetical protein
MIVGERGVLATAVISLVLCAASVAAAPQGASVSGTYKHPILGSFELVDGIAWKGPAGTVVQVTSKPIASAALAGTPCPATLARSIRLLRDARYLEVTLDAKGASDYYFTGGQYLFNSSDLASAGVDWTIRLTRHDAQRAAGTVERRRGTFQFDLPILQGGPGDRSAGELVRPMKPLASPGEDKAEAAYQGLRAAAAVKDWPKFLEAHGYGPDLVQALRALPGIEADLEAHAARFLTPGAVEAIHPAMTAMTLAANGRNPQGKSLSNVYDFAACGDRVLLVSISEHEP